MQLVSPFRLDRRVLAALELRDAATGERITAPMQLGSDQLGFIRNRSGLYVANSVLRAGTAQGARAALAAHLGAFETAPQTPAPGAVACTVTVEDPRGLYVPRRVTLALPLAQPSVPLSVEMFPAPAGRIAPNWSGIRIALSRTGPTGTPVPLDGALVSLSRVSDASVLGRGLSDARGEALVIAVGIPVIDFLTDADEDSAIVGTTSIAARIAVLTGPEPRWPPDPDAASGPEGIGWQPVAGAFPDPDLATGQIRMTGLSFLVEPQT